MNNPSSLQPTLRALADPTRREILEILKNGAMPAGEIAEHFSITGAAISRHLSVLKEADLVRDHREGKFIFYDINLSVLQEILVWIGNFKAARETSSGKWSKIIGTPCSQPRSLLNLPHPGGSGQFSTNLS